ncbi:NUDIX hydrolase [Streptomyces hygroscopicus]|uniref:NUDIX hydrolase n=1 Tax=Streptomyces hygroscopicus TaxID=1912 RepID=UPI00224072CE|nr:NUDIX domain-containing protein [Streptomyces hygroscopicus]
MGELVERVDEHDDVLGVVDRGDAIRHGWLHRIATIVCRDTDGRILVHRRPDDVLLFPGHFNWMLGGAVGVAESYEEAATRELAEELGVRGQPRFVFKFLCAGAISPYWLGLHEVVVTEPVQPDPSEIAWYDWLTESELTDKVRHRAFVPDAREAFERYSARSSVDTASPGTVGQVRSEPCRQNGSSGPGRRP